MNPASHRTAARHHQAEWGRWRDWCTGTDRNSLPARSQDVLAYLTEEQPSRRTAARWVAAIRTIHRENGFPDPCAGEVEAWIRRARHAGPITPNTLLTELRALLEPVPITGWPAGFFGRRDRLAYLLHRLGAVPATVLARLPADAVQITEPGTIQVTTPHRTWTLHDPGDVELCPACAVRAWHHVVTYAAAFDPRGLATHLTPRDPAPPHTHDCDTTSALEWPRYWALLPAITRWGHTQLPPVPAMSTRAIEALLHNITQGTPTAHANRSAHTTAPTASGESARSTGVSSSVPPRSDSTWHRRGLAARQAAAAHLSDVSDRWDDVDSAIEALTHRIDGTFKIFSEGDPA